MADWIGLSATCPKTGRRVLDEAYDESCNYDYSGTRYSQYASCMLIMGNQDFVETYEAQYGELGHVRFYLECTAVDWDGEDRVVTRAAIGIRRIAGRRERDREENKDEQWKVRSTDSVCRTFLQMAAPSSRLQRLLLLRADRSHGTVQVLGDVLMDADEQWRSH
jgi:hypothetical protein